MIYENKLIAYVNDLLKENHISLDTAILFAINHKAELEQIDGIFDLKTVKDAQILFTLLQILSTNSKDAEKFIAYFRNEDPENQLTKNVKPDLDQYKNLLLSAFVHDPSFFLMAWNWYGYIQNQVRKQEEKSQPYPVNGILSTAGKVLQFEPQPDWRIHYRAATVSGLQQFGEISLPNVGILRLLGTKTENSYLFQYRLNITGDISRPVALDIEFTTLKDGKSHHLQIKDEPDDLGEVVPSELAEGIDYSDGIIIHHITEIR